MDYSIRVGHLQEGKKGKVGDTAHYTQQKASGKARVTSALFTRSMSNHAYLQGPLPDDQPPPQGPRWS